MSAPAAFTGKYLTVMIRFPPLPRMKGVESRAGKSPSHSQRKWLGATLSDCTHSFDIPHAMKTPFFLILLLVEAENR